MNEVTSWEVFVISLTKLDNSSILVNLETIKYAEAMPDTVIRFVNGDVVIVRESLEEIERRVIDLKKRIFSDNLGSVPS